ncbi:MAG: hypothetical protein Q7R40_02385 [Phaeospirillum sp.]|nr:hypothetical protein [Phaeospirillum sp.]
MTRFRPILVSLLLLPLLAAPVMAADMGNRLVAGGASGVGGESPRVGMGDLHSPVLTLGGFSLGSVIDAVPSISTLGLPFASSRGGLAVGGYVSYGRGDLRLSSSLRGDGAMARADVTAAYAGAVLGVGNVASLQLGAAVARSQGFSVNPLQPGLALSDSHRGSDDLNLSFSLMHQVTPALSFGGTAGANQPNWSESVSSPGFMLGAGMGYRF